MPVSSEEFRALMERVLAGREDAAQELLRAHGPHLLRAVRHKLNKKLRSKFDSLDFVQDVWASFFAQLPRGHAFATPDDLAAFLATVAANKVIEAVRQRLAGHKYNLNREHSLDGSFALQGEAQAARESTPSVVAMSREEWEQLLGRQPLVHRRILILRRQGATIGEIARKMGLHKNTVQRVVQKCLPGLVS